MLHFAHTSFPRIFRSPLLALAVTVFFGLSTTVYAQVTASPNSATAGDTGVSVSFTITASAPPVPPQNRLPASVTLGGITGSNVSRSSDTNVTATFDLTSAQAGPLTVEISFTTPNGTISYTASDAFTLNAPAGTPLITSQPVGRNIRAGINYTLTVDATGGTGVYEWSRGSTVVQSGSSPSYTITSASETDSGSYTCRVLGATTDVTTDPVVVTVITTLPIPALPYTVVDSGQNVVTNNSAAVDANTLTPGSAFYGQDSQYAGNQPFFVDNGDGTVSDVRTGLMWSGDSTTTKYTYAQAVANASSYNLGGHNDWRLPSMKELYSLMDFRGDDPSSFSGTDTSALRPFLNDTYFTFHYGNTDTGERVIDAQFATTNLYGGTTINGAEDSMFGLNLADGRIKGYPQRSGGSDTDFYVLYVRDETASGYGTNDFENLGNGTVVDHATGLMWQQGDSLAGMDWEEALAYAESLELGGYNDWRLPNAKELHTLLDYNRAPDTTNSPALDPIFASTSITNEADQLDWPCYWTSTTHETWTGGVNSAVYICFGRAMGYTGGRWQDVHGAGAQRAEPKTGNPEDYPEGFGPQGDAVRIFNYVRCVRGGAVAPATDSDEDGLTDAFEYNYSDTAVAMIAENDDDGDGLTNLEEQAIGSSPNVPRPFAAVPATLSEGIESGLQYTVAWPSELGQTYRIERITDLASGATEVLAEGIPADYPMNSAEVGVPNDGTFLRVVVEAD